MRPWGTGAGNPTEITPMKNKCDIIAETILATFTLGGAVEIQAAASSVPKFSMLAYTGGLVTLDAYAYPVVVDLSGLTAARQSIPISRGTNVENIVGHSENIRIEATGVYIAGIISADNADSADILTSSKNGFPWRSTILIEAKQRTVLDAGKTAMVNGREVTGPVTIVRKSVLKAAGFCPLGGDANSSAIAAMDMSVWLAAKGKDPAALTFDEMAGLHDAFEAEEALEAEIQTIRAAAVAALGR